MLHTGFVAFSDDVYMHVVKPGSLFFFFFSEEYISWPICLCVLPRAGTSPQHCTDLRETSQRGLWSYHGLKSPETTQSLNRCVFFFFFNTYFIPLFLQDLK